MKKLLFVIDNLQIGGAEQVFVDIVNLCNYKVDFDVLLITQSVKKEYDLPNNIQVIHLNRVSKYSLLSAFNVYGILRKYSMAHIHMRHTFRYLALVKKIFGLKTEYLFHDHYGSIDIDQSLPFKFASFFKPDFYIGVCPKLQSWAINIWKLPITKTIFLNNLPSLRFENISEYPIAEKNNSLVMVGNIKAIKNQFFALKIALELELKISFIGKNQDNEYFTQLNNQLEGNCILQTCDDVSTELPKYRFGLFTSKSESGPLVLMEYLMMGLPFIAYKTGGISEVLFKYFPDFFIDSFDISIWKERITKFMQSPPIIDKVKVREIVDKEFNREVYFNQLMRIYEP